MQAIAFPAQGAVAAEERPLPSPGPGEVLVRIRASGLCHTDYEVREARYGSVRFPVVPGHEFGGEVAATGPGVTGLAKGGRVVADPNIACGSCRACRRGRINLCGHLGAYGVSCDGGFAEYAVLAAENLHGTHLPWDVAALAEPMGCVLNATGDLGLRGDEEALVIGAGPIGLLLAVALRAQGLARITLADLDEGRLALAESFGFGAVAAGSGEMARMARSVDLAADATGSAQVAAGLAGWLADGGAALFFGICPAEARIELAPHDLFRRQLRLLGTHSLNRNIPAALRVLEAAGPDISRLVSHRIPLREMAAVLATKPPKGSLKMQVAFG